MDVKATQAVEVTDISQTSVKSNDDSTISSTRMLPDVQFDSESSKEIKPKESGVSYSSQDKSNTRDVPDVSLDSGSSKESQTNNQCPTEDVTNTTKFDSEDTSEKKSNKYLPKRNQIKMKKKKKRTDHKVLLSSKVLLFSIQ